MSDPIPYVEENVIDPAASINASLLAVNALIFPRVQSIGQDIPNPSPSAGARYIVGTAPTGVWSGHANQLARWQDDHWTFYDCAVAVNLFDDELYIYGSAGWVSVSA